jgi:hypothetical protein
MPDALTATTLLALAALLTIPGLAAARAPWGAVAPLSASFWIVTWWWAPAVGRTRSGFLLAALLFLGTLVALRLLKPWGVSRPGWGTMFVLTLSLLRLAPAAFWETGPGPALALHSTQATLLTWRDGLPATSEPLIPLSAFGAAQPGLASLAADLALLAHVPPSQAAWLVSLAGGGLLQLAVFLFLRSLVPGRAAAWISVAALALTGYVEAFLATGDGGVLLATALALHAVDWLWRGKTPASVLGSGLALGATLMTDSRLALAALVVTGCAPFWGSWLRERGLRRGAQTWCVALLFAAPFLWRTRLAGLHPRLLEAAPGAPALTLAPLLGVALAVGVTAVLVLVWRRGSAAPQRWLLVLGACLAAAAALNTIRGYRLAREQIVVNDEARSALRWLAASTSAVDVVCCEGVVCPWIPALAGRAVEPPLVPLVYRGRQRSQDCRLGWQTLHASTAGEVTLFSSNAVRIVRRGP